MRLIVSLLSHLIKAVMITLGRWLLVRERWSMTHHHVRFGFSHVSVFVLHRH